MPYCDWTRTQAGRANERMLQAIKGRGRKHEEGQVIDRTSSTVQVRRLMTLEEIEFLPQDKLPATFSDHPDPYLGPFAKEET